MVLDNIAFHTEEDFPSDLSVAAAAIHIGYYWSWIVRRNLYNPQWDKEAAHDMTALKAGQLSGSEFILNNMAGRLEDIDFNSEGLKFSLYYYTDEEDGYGWFIEDYIRTLNTPTLASFYHVEISAENQLLLDGVFDAALAQWRKSLKPTH